MAEETKPVSLLKKLAEIIGSEEVYYNPPSNIKMKYPACIVKLQSADSRYADSDPYLTAFRYQITLIQRVPDSAFIREITRIKRCKFIRSYNSDNLRHDVYEWYEDYKY